VNLIWNASSAAETPLTYWGVDFMLACMREFWDYYDDPAKLERCAVGWKPVKSDNGTKYLVKEVTVEESARAKAHIIQCQIKIDNSGDHTPDTVAFLSKWI